MSHRAPVVPHAVVPELRDLTHVARLYRRAVLFFFAVIRAVAARLWLLRVVADDELALVDLRPLVVCRLSVVVKVVVERWIVMMLSLVVVARVGRLSRRLLVRPTQDLLVRLRLEVIQDRRWLFDLREDGLLCCRQNLRLDHILGKRHRGEVLVGVRRMVVSVIAVALRLPREALVIRLLLIDEWVRRLLTCRNTLLFPLLRSVRSH